MVSDPKKLSLKWRKRAQQQRKNIFAFYNKRNGTDEYSLKLNRKINEVLAVICENPEFGQETSKKNIRRQIIEKRFALFYRITENAIEVTALVDARQDRRLD